MPLRIKCPTGHTLIVPDDRAGRTLRCPRCSQPFTVPGEGKESGAGSQESGVREQGSAIGKLMAVAAKAVGGSGTTKIAKPAVKGPSAKGQPVVKPKSRALPLPEKPVEKVAEKSPAKPPAPPPKQPEAKPEPVVKAPELPQFEPEPPPVVSEQVEAPPVIAVQAPPAVEPPSPTGSGVFGEKSPTTVSEPNSPKTPDPFPVAPPVTAELVAPAAPVVPEAIVEPPLPEAPAAEPAPEPQVELAAAVAAPVEPALPEPTPPPPVVEEKAQPVTITLAADRSKVLVVYQLAGALIMAALFSMVPAIWDVVEYIQFYDMVADPHVARWALVLFFLGIVQLAYAVYLFQLPDWTSVWVVTMYSLLMAAIYAATLGMVLISREDGGIVGGLQLADKLTGGKAALWCLCMVSVSTMLAFFAGRLSVRWHKAEMLLRRAGV